MLGRCCVHNENHNKDYTCPPAFMQFGISNPNVFPELELRIISQILLFMSKFKWKTLNTKANSSA
mgnify:CR=1 FL=1